MSAGATWLNAVVQERAAHGWFAGGPLSVSCDQMACAASYLRQNWADYGYRFEAVQTRTHMVSVFRVVCSDGSRFSIVADVYGNVRHLDTHESDRGLSELVAEMHAAAVAP